MSQPPPPPPPRPGPPPATPPGAYDPDQPRPFPAGAVATSTTFTITDHQIDEHLGVIFGLVVRSMGFARSFTGSFSALRQGEVTQYTEVLEDARRHALDRLVENAHFMGANAVIGVRFDSTEIGNNMSEIVAYGSAVRVSPTHGSGPAASGHPDGTA
jgi:uncharacterized protein YbjQ (UPF0145 family)